MATSLSPETGIKQPDAKPARLIRTPEEILEPDLPIVDPHHYLWDAPRTPYLLESLLADTGSGHNVVASVFVECAEHYYPDGPQPTRPVGETAFVAALTGDAAAASTGTRACSGIIGYADLRLGAAVREVLEAHMAAGDGRFRGIRQPCNRDPANAVGFDSRTPPARLLYDMRLREGFAELAPLGLSFDAWLFHPQLADLVDLAKTFPDTTIVLNHAGGILGTGPYADKRDEIFHEWSQSIRLLAQHENVYIKLGGLGMPLAGFGFHELGEPPGSQELAQAWRPYIHTCIEEFGFSRAMFESNFPLDRACCSYATLWNTFKRLAQDCSALEKADLFSGTAARAYRLSLPPSPAA